MKTSDHKRFVDNLAGTNDPPSDEQRLELKTSLRGLEVEFERVVGQPFTKDLKEKEIPDKAKSIRDAIQLHRSILSNVRLITAEIWQTIFEMVSEPEKADDRAPNIRALACLCRVSRQWHVAATTHCRLWVRLPTFWIYSKKIQSLEKTKNALNLFISRSGVLPLSFSYSIYRGIWKVREDHVRELLKIVVKESHRWKDVSLRLPFDARKELAPVKGRLQMLEKLSLDFGHSFSTSQPQDTIIDYFEDAPRLREVDVRARYVFDSIINTSHPKIVIKLPVAQLEIYRVEAHSDSVFPQLLGMESSALREVEVCSYWVPPLPSAPLTLPSLEKLDFRTGMDGSTITALLELLTLPALVDLEIRANFQLPDTLYETVLDMIRRSSCSLTRLALDNADVQPNVIRSILELSPRLGELDVFACNPVILEALVLDRASAVPTAPKLKKMTLRNAARGLGLEVLNGDLFMRMLTSRMGALENADPEIFQQLEEVFFVWEDDDMLHRQMIQLESAEREATTMSVEEEEKDAPLRRVASNAWLDLKTKLVRYWHPRRHYFNLKLHIKLDRHMRELEAVKLTEGSALVLMRRGVPHLLNRLKQMSRGRVLGDRIFRFRSRGAALLEKWRPFLLKDLRSCPYRWSHCATGVALLRKTVEDEEDGDVWKDVIGIPRDPKISYDTMAFTPWLW